MCGILAIIIKNKEENIQEIKKGFEVLSKRGPDNSTFNITDEHITGFTRLSIIDITSTANQPFVLDNTIMMCNGEIYNYQKLKEKYKLECISNSDCEVIIRLYKKIGFTRTIKLLDGDFAVILIDNDKIYFARDQIGVRPLYMGYTKSGNMAIASIAGSLNEYCDNIFHLEPNIYCYSKILEKLYTYNYYYPNYETFYGPNIFTHVNNTLTKAVSKRLMSDRPMCCMLSGGLDSSLITSILCKLIGPSNVRTYSIGMANSTDLKYARIVADYLGTQHTEVLFTAEEGFEAIPHVIKDIESYDITTIRASVGMWLLAKYISINTSDIVILSGEGSDELFFGYLYFHLSPSAKESNEESKRLIKEIYLYDGLRADRTISSFGLELRVPFLDKDLINLCFTIDSELKIPINGIEKHLLRYSFKDNYLPDEILWRKKEAFSDGVSDSTDKKWFLQIQDRVEHQISNEEYNNYNNKFPSKEAYYYKKIYDSYFPTYQPTYNYWLPKWINTNGEPSATILSCY